MELKIIQLNYSDINGGAARAAYRIHHALRAAGVNSTMAVNVASAGDWTVQGPSSGFARARSRTRSRLAFPLRGLLRTRNLTLHSPAIIPSRWPQRLNVSNADLINLHWLQGEMLSIADIARIRKPIVWTLHDMWAFCGAEHYTTDSRWRDGYRGGNRPAFESGFDLNRYTWQRKRSHWQQPIHIVTPSQWLADCVQQSALMHDWPLSVVPNCLDTARWQPINQQLARQLLGLPIDVPTLLFGASGGAEDPRKGFDLLLQALGQLRSQRSDLHLLVFGQLAPREPPELGFPIHYTGPLHDDFSLRALYSAADLMVVPSRQDNLPSTAVEAHACGTPVVAFRTGGLPDIVEHKRTGYLAQPFDTQDLAAGISWVLEDPQRRICLGHATRQRAERLWNPARVAGMYEEVYRSVIEQRCRY